MIGGVDLDSSELDFYKKKIHSLIDRASQGVVVLTPFLDLTKQTILKEMVGNRPLQVSFYGGFLNSEYQRAILSLNQLDKEFFKVVVYQIDYNKKFLSIHHRMILGSLMALGIQRQSIGDIHILEDGKCYFSCSKEISPYIQEHFKTIGKVGIRLIPMNQEIEVQKKIKIVTQFVASMRLDVVISAAYHLSRSDTQERIQSGEVSVNHLTVLHSSQILKVQDIVSVRHKGRVVIHKIGGNTKSNRIILELAYAC